MWSMSGVIEPFMDGNMGQKKVAMKKVYPKKNHPVTRLPDNSPEAHELEKKPVQLANLESQMAEMERERNRLRNKINALENQYLKIVGVRYTKLDSLKAFVSEFLEGSGKLNKNNRAPIQPANSQPHPMSEGTGKVIQLDKKKKSSKKNSPT